jgi:hypothetical protein
VSDFSDRIQYALGECINNLTAVISDLKYADPNRDFLWNTRNALIKILFDVNHQFEVIPELERHYSEVNDDRLP